MKQYINDELYDYLFEILNDCINDETYLSQQIKQLNIILFIQINQVFHYKFQL